MPMANSPEVSIVMPVWKPHADWYPTAVASALEQEGCSTELIVVDDGNDPPVRLPPFAADAAHLVRIEHAGPAAARDAGRRAARGNWIRFADADDVLPPDGTFHLLRAAAVRPDAALVFGDTLLCDATLTPHRLDHCRLRKVTAVDCLLGRFNAWLPAMLFARDVAEVLEPSDSRLEVSTDWDYVLRALDHGPGYRVPRCVYIYRQHHGSLSTSGDRGRGSRAAREIVGSYFARHPEQRGTRIEGAARRRVEAHEFRDSLSGVKWWRNRRFWAGLVIHPRPALRALPVLIRSSLPRRLSAVIHRLRGRRGASEHPPQLPPPPGRGSRRR